MRASRGEKKFGADEGKPTLNVHFFIRKEVKFFYRFSLDALTEPLFFDGKGLNAGNVSDVPNASAQGEKARNDTQSH